MMSSRDRETGAVSTPEADVLSPQFNRSGTSLDPPTESGKMKTKRGGTGQSGTRTSVRDVQEQSRSPQGSEISETVDAGQVEMELAAPEPTGPSVQWAGTQNGVNGTEATSGFGEGLSGPSSVSLASQK